jgi:hypothetical protein
MLHETRKVDVVAADQHPTRGATGRTYSATSVPPDFAETSSPSCAEYVSVWSIQ